MYVVYMYIGLYDIILNYMILYFYIYIVIYVHVDMQYKGSFQL